VGFRIQKRINLGKGLGLNIGKTGISTSYRSKAGSIGSKGYSIRTGIPGVSYRGFFNKGCLMTIVFLLSIATIFLLIINCF